MLVSLNPDVNKRVQVSLNSYQRLSIFPHLQDKNDKSLRY